MRSDPSNAAVRLVVPEARDRADVPRFDAPAWETRAVSPEPQSPAKDERDLRLEELGHDLRVPLSAISMGIQLVQRDVPAKAALLSSMLLMVKRMNRLIDQCLRSAHSGASGLVLNHEAVSLAAICREAIGEGSLAYPGHPIEFERYDDAPGEWDRDRLLQVLRNLLSNALRHGAPGEPVIVSVIDLRQEAVLTVANRGPRIPDRFREQFLDPSPRAAGPSGHLGLGIVKEIVQAHGGRVELTSDDNATVFRVRLPKRHENSLRRDHAMEARP